MAIDKSIEVTEEMMDAGFKVLAASGTADDYLEGDRLLVAEIFRAMHLCNAHPAPFVPIDQKD